VIGPFLEEIYSSVLMIDIDLDYVLCVMFHLILIVLLESITRKLVMRGGWQQHSFCYI